MRVEFLLPTVLTLACVDASDDVLLVTSGARDQVFVLDPASGVVRDSVAMDARRGEIDEPHGIVAAPDHAHWYATLSHGEPTLWKFAAAENRLVGRTALHMAGASRIGLTRDGRFAYIPDYYRDNANVLGQLTLVRLDDLAIVASARVCTAPHDAQPAPNNELVAVACSTSDEIKFLTPQTLQPVHTVQFASIANAKPLNLVWAPDANSVYVTLHLTGEVARVHPEAGVVQRVAVGAGPAQIAVAATRDVLVTANRGDRTASLLSIADGVLERVAQIPLGVAHPHGVALSSDERLAFITYEGTADTRGGVVAIDLESASIRWRREVGTYTLGVTYITHR